MNNLNTYFNVTIRINEVREVRGIENCPSWVYIFLATRDMDAIIEKSVSSLINRVNLGSIYYESN